MMNKHSTFSLTAFLILSCVSSAKAFPIFAFSFSETQSSPLSSPLSLVNFQATPDSAAAEQPCKSGGPGDADLTKGIGIGSSREDASVACQNDVRHQLADWRQECKSAGCVPHISYQASASCNGGGPVTCTCSYQPSCIAK